MDNKLKELWDAIGSLRGKRGGANATEFQGRHASSASPSDKDLWIWDDSTKKWKPSGSAQVKFCRCTANLTLTTSAQSITGDGDSTKVRLLLPTIGEWLVFGTFDFEVTAADPDECIGELYVADGGTGETGVATFGKGQVDRGTVSQKWKVTTTSANTAVELKARKLTDAGVALALATHTTLAATIGAGGGSVTAASDHGNLDGLGDTADHNWALLVDGTRAMTGNLDMAGNDIDNLVAKAANEVFAGPASGANATPAFRALVDADLPDVTRILETGDPATLTFGVIVAGQLLRRDGANAIVGYFLVPADIPSGTTQQSFALPYGSPHSIIALVGPEAGNSGKGIALMPPVAMADSRIATFPDATGTVAYLADLHAQAHTVASHSDTTATGAETETLTDGSDADALHDHATLITAAEAIAAVEGEATLDLTGDVTIAAAKSLALDTIAEKTGAAGVTADGVKLKDGSAIIADAGYIGSVSDPDAIQIEADGDVVLTQDLAVTGTLGVTGAVDINSGTIDGVTIGGAAAPTTTDIGTVAAGTWQGGVVAATYGGTGVADPTDHAVLVGSGAGAITPVAAVAGPSATAGFQYFRSPDAATDGAYKEVMRTVAITIEDPAADEDIAVTFFFQAVTIREVQAVVVGTSCTIDPYHNTDRSAGGNGTDVLDAATAITNTTTGQNLTSFTDATIPADSWLILKTTAVTACTEINITFRYTIDS